MTEQRHYPRTFSQPTFLTPFLIVMAGLILTTALFFEARQSELDNFRLQFERDAAMRCNLIAKKMEECLVISKALQRFFVGSGHVDRKEFATFTIPFLAEQRELQALEWIPRVSYAERTHYEEMGRRPEMPKFQIMEHDPNRAIIPAKVRESYYPVFYVEPLEGNEKAVGFDLGSNPVRRAALERARDTGEPTVTQRIRLVQETGEQFGFLIFLSVYRKGMPTETVEQRRAALEGFALGVFRVGNALGAVLGNTDPLGLPFDLLDLSAPGEERLLHHWDARLKPEDSWKSSFFPIPPRYFGKFVFADREWGMEITANQGYMERHYPFAYWLILPIGLLLTFVLGLYIQANLSQRVRLEQTVLERTAELQKLASIVRHSKELIYLSTLEGRMIFINEAGVKMLGIDPEKVEELNIIDIIPDHLKEKAQTQLLPTLMEQGIWEGDLQYRNQKTGTLIDVHATTFTIKDLATNAPLYLANVSLDITERKRTEQALWKQYELQRVLLSAIPAYVYIKDTDSVYMLGNKQFSEFSSVPENEIPGKTDYDFFSETDADCFRRDDAEIIATGKARMNYEMKGKDSKGNTIWFSTSKSPFYGPSGEKAGLVGICIDITEHKRAEEAVKESEIKFMVLTEKAVVGVYLIQNGVFKYVNPRGSDILGYTVDELVMKAPKDFVAPEDWPMVREYLYKGPSGEFDFLHNEFRMVKKSGEFIFVEAYGSRIIYNGQPAIMGTLIDISSRRRAEEEQRHREKLQGILEMAGAICHEMNQPMQIISGYSELLMNDLSENDAMYEKLSRIVTQIDRMGTITGKLMKIKDYETQEYAGFSRIIDINKSSGEDTE